MANSGKGITGCDYRCIDACADIGTKSWPYFYSSQYYVTFVIQKQVDKHITNNRLHAVLFFQFPLLGLAMANSDKGNEPACAVGCDYWCIDACADSHTVLALFYVPTNIMFLLCPKSSWQAHIKMLLTVLFSISLVRSRHGQLRQGYHEPACAIGCDYWCLDAGCPPRRRQDVDQGQQASRHEGRDSGMIWISVTLILISRHLGC